MKKNIYSFVLVSLISAFATMSAYADTISITGTVPAGAAVSSDNVYYVTAINLHDNDNGIDFVGFCGDFATETSKAFGTSAGQEYGYSFLPDDSIYTPQEKSYIQSLFDHTYSVAFDASGNSIDRMVERAIQITLWNVINGVNVVVTADGTTLASNFLAAVYGNISWESIGYGNTTDTTLVVFRSPENASQTLISANYVTGGYNTDNPNPTPEPATLLILGLGAMGAGFAARRRMTK